ncbi:ABC transporter permease [Mariniblastus fucicola]|uniref:FtsX-like permease family protein n=1 Tax=Mariniblastus fucicola TaxID=980251 RepID=A0A5B9PMT5_9BACT|nr:ABC transporter permease [Mariniblastus fucicola]QEG23901.1 FtsX-like permease family protein [Mariniblastus fucicola]
MNSWHLAIQSFKHYLPVNLAIALGVAAATAVLTGALLVGDSMRTSLRDLTLDRLGETDDLLISRGFFDQSSMRPDNNQELAAFWDQSVPAILFNNGTVETQDSSQSGIQRAANVNVFGVPNEFWQLDTSGISVNELSGDTAIINRALADQLGIADSESASPVTLRIPKPTQLPAESALGAKRDLIESLVGIEVVQILPNEGLAGFSMHQSQLDSPNIFVPVQMLQDSLSRSALRHKSSSEQVNVSFLGRTDANRAAAADFQNVLRELPRTLEDEGISLKRVTQTFESDGQSATVFDYWTLSSEQLVLLPAVVSAIEETFPGAKPVFTYLANDIRKSDSESGIPFSMIAAIDIDDAFPLRDVDGQRIQPPSEDEIVINEWAANDIDVDVGDSLTIAWFDPETTHGKQTKQEATLVVSAIAALTEPYEAFEVRRRGEVVPAKFDTAPTLANDPNLTPEVPGVTDAESIENWDLPFETASKLRPSDDTYWENHRTTPKAFVSFATGQKLWSSRFGDVTSYRIPAKTERSEIQTRLLSAIAETKGASGFELITLRQNALTASSGSTPFDVLFLALSMFVIASGLILVSLLFRLTLQSRASEVGLLQAVGLPAKRVSGIWIREMLLVCILGAVLGILIGIGYAAAMIWGLKTWWVGAISKPIIDLHIGPVSILIGFVSGILICVGTIFWALRSLRRQSVRGMLAGRIDESASLPNRKSKKWMPVAIVSMLVLAVILSVLAINLSGDAQAGSFMGSGFCVLAAMLMFVYSMLERDGESNSATDLQQLALMSLRRNPLRSTLTIGLVAVASFLIAAVSSFRLTPTEQGTAGFDYVAQSSQPLFSNLSSADGQTELLDATLPPSTRVFGFRFKPGEDASCNNLYQSTQPRVLGATQDFIDSFNAEVPAFAWGGSVAESDAESANPWTMLNRSYDDGAIPVIIDKNTANYSLKIFAPGGDYVVHFDTGETVTFRVVGFLSNTILQGSLLVSEDSFVRAFPYLGGSRYFLIDSENETDSAQAVAVLEQQLGDEGFDARSAPRLLANFMSVQNTYLSTFQSLGALGLLLGTFGLAAVQIRNVLERKRELGLMRAVGFGKGRLAGMILIENGWLLGTGLVVGILAALCGTLPHYLFGDASVPWVALGGIFIAIFAIGIVASLLATRILSQMNLLDSLKA